MFRIAVFFCLLVLFAACSTAEDPIITDSLSVSDTSVSGDCAAQADTAAGSDSAADAELADMSPYPDGEETLQPDGDTAYAFLATVNSFSAAVDNLTITLTWKNPTAEGFQKVKLLTKTGGPAANPSDGVILYEGTAETYTYTDTVEIGKTYYFTIFADYGAQGISSGVDKAVVPCYSKLDVVFVMDVSTTMTYILQTLHDQMKNVWDTATALNVEPQFGLTVFVDDFTVVNGAAPYTTLEAIQSDFDTWRQHTSTNRQTQSTKTNSDMPENTLDALAAASDQFGWRDVDYTLRIIIHTTDDTFLEKPGIFKSGVAAQHTYKETIDLLTGKKIRVGTFAAKKAERPTIEEPSGWKDITAGYFADYSGMKSIPEATGGGVYDIDLVGQPAPDGISMDISINDFIKDKLCLPY